MNNMKKGENAQFLGEIFDFTQDRPTVCYMYLVGTC